MNAYLYYEQFSKHKNEINWFYSKPDQEIWCKHSRDNLWTLTKSPSWQIDKIYAINDDKAEIRKAFIDGKQVEVAVSNEHRPASNIDIKTLPAKILRIKPSEQNFTIGEYIVMNKPNSTPFLCKQEWMDKLDIDSYSLFIKWKPTDDELVWVWDAWNEEYIVTRYRKVQLNYDNIAPFVGQLPEAFVYIMKK